MHLSRFMFIVCFYLYFSCVIEESESSTVQNDASTERSSSRAHKRSPQAEHEVNPKPIEVKPPAESVTTPGETTVSVQVETEISKPTAAPNADKLSNGKEAAKSVTKTSSRGKPKAKMLRKAQRKNNSDKPQTRVSKPANVEPIKQADNRESDLKKSSDPETRLGVKVQGIEDDKVTEEARKDETKNTEASDSKKETVDTKSDVKKNNFKEDSEEHTEGSRRFGPPSKDIETHAITEAPSTDASNSTDSTTDASTITEKENVDNIESVVDEHPHNKYETERAPGHLVMTKEDNLNKKDGNDNNNELIKKLILQMEKNEQMNRKRFGKGDIKDDHHNTNQFTENRRSFSSGGGLGHKPSEELFEEAEPLDTNIPFDSNRFYISNYNPLEYKSNSPYHQSENSYKVPSNPIFRQLNNVQNFNAEIPQLALPSDFERVLNQRIEYQTQVPANAFPNRRTANAPQFNASPSLPQEILNQNSRYTEPTPKTVFQGFNQNDFSDKESGYNTLNNVFRQQVLPLPLNHGYNNVQVPLIYTSQPKLSNPYLPPLNLDPHLSQAKKYQHFFNNLYFRDPQLQNQYSINEYVNYLQTIQSLNPNQNFLSHFSNCDTKYGTDYRRHQYDRTLEHYQNIKTTPELFNAHYSLNKLPHISLNNSPNIIQNSHLSNPLCFNHNRQNYDVSICLSPNAPTHQYFPGSSPNQGMQQMQYSLSNPTGLIGSLCQQHFNPPLLYANGYDFLFKYRIYYQNCRNNLQNYMQYLQNYRYYSNNPINAGSSITGMYGYG